MPALGNIAPMIRRLLAGLAATLALLGLAYLFGPVQALDTRTVATALPAEAAELERWLAASERRLGDVIPGAEKTVRWAHEDRRRTALAIIYLHGYTATRQEVDPLCDELAAALGANVYYTRLAGHGRKPAAMGEVTGTDWLQDARDALAIGRSIGERVIVVGTSTGGTLGLWLAGQPGADDIAAQILISPNLGPRDSKGELLAGPWGAQLLALLVGEEYRWIPHNAEHARYWNWRYPSRALLPMMALVRHVRESPLEAIRIPTLTIYSPHDKVVDAGQILRAHQRLGAAIKPLYAIENSADPSSHVLAGRVLAPGDTPRVRARILGFVGAIGLPINASRPASPAATT
jgi:esterase/lipase